MARVEDHPPRLTAARWIRASSWGWLLGLVAIVGLALISDLLGGQLQMIVGLGMGVGLGYAQGRALRGVVAGAGRWVWATAGGLGIPFLAWDLSALVGLDSLFDAPRGMLLGGLLAGCFQYMLLRSGPTRASSWIAWSVVAWGVPAAAIAVGDRGLLPAPASTIMQLGTYVFGGVLVGLVSAKPLVRLLGGGRATSSHEGAS